MEKITLATIFKSFDGLIFESEVECIEYEKKRKDFLNKIKFFKVMYSPDLTETGMFCKGLLLAVYSDNYLQYEIAMNYCIKRFGYLGKSVQGHRFQRHFSMGEIDFKKFDNGTIEIRFGRNEVSPKLLLSPNELEEFKNIERFNYMEEWGFK